MEELRKKKKKIDKGVIKLSLLLVFFVILFILIGHRYPKEIQDFLKKPLLSLPSTEIDLWSFTHFGLFVILGYMFPHHLFELFMIGLFWEIFEDALAPQSNKHLVNCNKEYKNSWKETFKTVWCKHTALDKDYWYGKWDDIFCNVVGLVVGHFLRHTF